jgi:hypothetical protein
MLKQSENGVPRKILGLKNEEVTGNRRKVLLVGKGKYLLYRLEQALSVPGGLRLPNFKIVWT